MTKLSRIHHSRRGGAAFFVIAALILLGCLAVGIWYLVQQATEPEEIQVISFTVVKGEFEHVVTEQGEVESSDKIEIRCMVEDPTSNGTEIVWIIEDGDDVEGPEIVKAQETAQQVADQHKIPLEKLQELNPNLDSKIKNGDDIIVKHGTHLITFNKKSLQDARDNQNKAVVSAQSNVTASDNKVTQATISLEEYQKGTFLQEKQLIESEILVQQEKHGRAKDTAKFSSRLAALGFLTAEQLKADLFAVKQAEVDLALAQSRMDTLQNITKKKMEVGFQSDIKAAQAELDAKTAILQQEQSKLNEINLNLVNCEIYAPAKGQVLYHNVYSSRSGRAEQVVEAGARIGYRRIVIDLPNPQLMQVKSKINEGAIRYVRNDLEAIITIGALQGQRIEGKVIKVNPIPEPTAFFGSQVKEYGTYIQIVDPPETIRSGMTAEVKILVERQEGVLLIPVQALHEVAGHYFCLVQTEAGLETREIKIGSTNEKMVVIDTKATQAASLKGIQENEIVVENLNAHKKKLVIPQHLQDADLNSIGKKGQTVKAAKPQTGRLDASPSDGQQQPQGSSGNRQRGSLMKYDKDGDGKVSQEELPPGMPAEAFQRWDKNKDGFIDKQEAAARSGGSGRDGRSGRPGGAP
jgi:multidrug resistance efflux pump